jgi:uncharacterized protein DUF4386
LSNSKPVRGVVTSPQVYARVAGLLYLIVIVAGIFAEIFVRGRLVVAGDAAATAHNIVTHSLRYRLGFAAELVALLCNVPLALIFYELFKVVNRRVTLLVVFFSLVGTAIESVDLLNHLAPLTLLGGGDYLSTIPIEQLQAQAYLSLKLFDLGFAICLAFFGCFCLSLGYLIVRSGFLPRIIGVLLAFQGICYLVNSFTDFLAPRFATLVFSILAVSAVGEISLCLWLLVMGVNVAKWDEKARRFAPSGEDAGLSVPS